MKRPSLQTPVLALVLNVDDTTDLDQVCSQASAAVRGGANMLQIRAKNASEQAQRQCAEAIARSIGANAKVVLNGNPEIAVDANLHGVHLPEEGANIAQIRQVVGDSMLIGRSVHSLQSATQAEEDGADYVFFGTVFESASHPDGPTSGVDAVAAVNKEVSIPVIAIGGITATNCKSVMSTGASGVAVIGAIINQNDVYRAARTMARCIRGGQSYSR